MPTASLYDIIIIGTGRGGGTLAYNALKAGCRACAVMHRSRCHVFLSGARLWLRESFLGHVIPGCRR